jgi:hypothetical protein
MNYTYWKEYFESNQHHFKNINWDAPDSLTGDEKRIITKSIQQFQEGENSEGKHLFQFAKALNDDEYLSCIRLFIKEEHNHAKVLGRFMEKYKIEKAKGHWVDGVFRWLRKLMGLENSIIVLVTAEIISKIYYDALRNATGSALLQKICSQVLQDEDQHIAFQCHTLSLLHEKKNFLSRFISRSWHLFLMTGTILVVWFYHKKCSGKEVIILGGFFCKPCLFS